MIPGFTQTDLQWNRSGQFSFTHSVLLTVVFTMVLFFGGINGSLPSARLRISFVVIALLLFVGTVVTLGTMPICGE